MTDNTSVHSTPPTPRRNLSELERTLIAAANLSSILVTLMESENVLDVYAHYGDKAYHDERRKNPRPPEPIYIDKQTEEVLLWTLYELAAQVRSARDQWCGTDDDAPAEAAAEAA